MGCAGVGLLSADAWYKYEVVNLEHGAALVPRPQQQAATTQKENHPEDASTRALSKDARRAALAAAGDSAKQQWLDVRRRKVEKAKQLATVRDGLLLPSRPYVRAWHGHEDTTP
eukprot:COSAG01_NODE_24970_length_760_cov_0.924357_2_plen_114_part_00